ncbi:MAG TPA: YitT family protein [Fusobacterium sp.]|uniref:YitT family protein n=1 Tax=Fusobacterium sp. TaxID=68766 RepID=UPI002F3E9EFE
MKNRYLPLIRDYCYISFACVLMGFAINYFYISNKLAEGGVAGIALILHYLSDISASYLYLAINLPLLIISWKFLGRDFSLKTIYGTFVLSFFINFFSYLRTPIPDFLLASLFGGALVGISLGIIFISGGSSGGTDIIAKLIHRYFGVPIGKTLLILDFIILSFVAFLFGKLIFMYTLIAVTVSSKMIDFIQEGIDEAKGIFIITSKPKEIKTAIVEQIGRGVTFLHGEGGFSGENLKILYCVVGKYQLLSLKKIVKDLDSHAFITVTNVHEVLGNGFKKLQEEEKKAD